MGDLGSWLADSSDTSLTVLFPAVLAVALAAVTHLGLRRTVP